MVLLLLGSVNLNIDADNFDNFEDTCINTCIDTISATIASTSKNGNSDGMTA